METNSRPEVAASPVKQGDVYKRQGFTRQELDNPETRLLSIIERRIQKKEDILKEIDVYKRQILLLMGDSS